jgi:predicted transcriptional regulator
MKLLCETVFTEILPVLRAIIAKELLEKYEMTQKEVAKILGVTQPAISQYKDGIRGNKKLSISNERIVKLGKKIAAEISSNNINFYEKICDIVCNEARKEFSNKELHEFLCLLEIEKVKK